MALFKSRKGREEQPAATAQAPAQTVEAVRRRAMHRLIGAAVLVLAGVIGFPMIFDNQPRPIPVDLPIEIVDKNRAKPLVVPPPAAPAATVAPVQPAQPDVATTAAVESKPAQVAAPAPAAPAVAPPPAPAPAPAAEAPESRSAVDAKKAKALLEGKTPPGDKPATTTTAAAPAAPAVPAKEAEADGRFVVQVGAFAESSKVREVRRKVEAAGYKTYTQVVATAEGSRTRVRVGPFSDKGEAGKAADKIRKLDLPAAVLTL